MRIKTLGLALIAIFAMSSVAAATASASAPNWLVNGTALSSGTSVNILGSNLIPSNLGVQEFKGGNVWIKCPMVNINSGSITGGSATVAGTDEAEISFTGCETGSIVEGKEEPADTSCVVKTATAKENNEIVLSVKTELVFNGTKAQAEKGEGPIGDLYTPKSGTEFVKIKFEGSPCPATGELIVTGNIVASQTESPAEVGQLTFPSGNSGGQKYWKAGETSSAAKTASLKSGGGTTTDTQTGKVGVMISGDTIGVTP